MLRPKWSLYLLPQRNRSRPSSRSPHIMSDISLRQSLKLAFFLVCVGLFVWKTWDCVNAYLAFDVGTTVTFVDNVEAIGAGPEDGALPSIAICRDPNSILNDDASYGDYGDDGWEDTLWTSYNLTNEDMGRLSVFRHLADRNTTYRAVYEQYLRNPPADNHIVYWAETVGGQFLLPHGGFAPGFGNGSDSDSGKSFVHPIHGRCAVAVLSGLPKTESDIMLVTMQIDKKVDVTIESGPNNSTETTTEINNATETTTELDNTAENSTNTAADNDTDTSWQELPQNSDTSGHYYLDSFANHLMLAPFQPDQFYMTSRSVFVSRGTKEVVQLEQKVVDRAKVPGEKCQHLDDLDDGETFDEDACLNACLRERFLREAGCLHPRLAKTTVGAERDCQFEDLERLLDGEDYIPELTKDPGLDLLLSLQAQLHEPGRSRCHCPMPCRRKYLSLHRWRVLDDYEHYDMASADFQFEPKVMWFDSYQVYTATNLFAEIGGYMGLLLGLSIYSFASFFVWLQDKWKKLFNVEPEPEPGQGRGSDPRTATQCQGRFELETSGK